jgi:hypothetical protein
MSPDFLEMYGLDRNEMNKLADATGNYNLAQETRDDVSSKKFDYYEGLGSSVMTLTGAGSRFMPTAKMMNMASYSGRQELRDEGITQLQKAMTGYNSATSIQERAGFKQVIDGQLKHLQGLGMNTIAIRGEVGRELFEKTRVQMNQDALVDNNSKINEVYTQMLGGVGSEGMAKAGKLVAELDTKVVKLDTSGTPFSAIDAGALDRGGSGAGDHVEAVSYTSEIPQTKPENLTGDGTAPEKIGEAVAEGTEKAVAPTVQQQMEAKGFATVDGVATNLQQPMAIDKPVKPQSKEGIAVERAGVGMSQVQETRNSAEQEVYQNDSGLQVTIPNNNGVSDLNNSVTDTNFLRPNPLDSIQQANPDMHRLANEDIV